MEDKHEDEDEDEDEEVPSVVPLSRPGKRAIAAPNRGLVSIFQGKSYATSNDPTSERMKKSFAEQARKNLSKFH